jgi:ribosomal protein uS19
LNSIRRRFTRGLPRKYTTLLAKLRKAKKAAPMHEKPDVVKTHLRNMVILPEMIGSVVGVYNGKTFTAVEIKVSCVLAGSYLYKFC